MFRLTGDSIYFRTIFLEYGNETKVLGVPGLEYRGGFDLVDPGVLDEENTCYCTDECPPLGLLNLTECRQGAPIFMSYPHFYLADANLTESVTGMNPNQEEHEFSMVVEPVSYQLLLQKSISFLSSVESACS